MKRQISFRFKVVLADTLVRIVLEGYFVTTFFQIQSAEAQ